jgi:hypothetical protein
MRVQMGLRLFDCQYGVVAPVLVTDWDPRDGGGCLGKPRVAEIIRAIETIRSGAVSAEVEAALAAEDGAFRDSATNHGCFLNADTLEIDLFWDRFDEQITETLLEAGFGPTRQQRIREWGEEPWALDKAGPAYHRASASLRSR